MTSERFSTYSHPLIALTPKKFKDVSNAKRLFWRQKSLVWPPRANAVQLCSFSVSVTISCWKESVHDQLQSPNRFFFFNFKNYGSDGRLLSSLPSQMIRKRLKLFGQFLSIGLSDCTLYVNYTLALLKSKIPIDLNQPVTLLSLNPEVTKESRIKKKNTHTTLTLTCHRKRICQEVSESILQVTVYCGVLKENHAITFEVLGLCACIVQSRPRLEIYFHSQKHG